MLLSCNACTAKGMRSVHCSNASVAQSNLSLASTIAILDAQAEQHKHGRDTQQMRTEQQIRGLQTRHAAQLHRGLGQALTIFQDEQRQLSLRNQALHSQSELLDVPLWPYSPRRQVSVRLLHAHCQNLVTLEGPQGHDQLMNTLQIN
jgi:hypothetical protein